MIVTPSRDGLVPFGRVSGAVPRSASNWHRARARALVALTTAAVHRKPVRAMAMVTADRTTNARAAPRVIGLNGPGRGSLTGGLRGGSRGRGPRRRRWRRGRRPAPRRAAIQEGPGVG